MQPPEVVKNSVVKEVKPNAKLKSIIKLILLRKKGGSLIFMFWEDDFFVILH